MNLRLRIVMSLAHWLGVPVMPHQRYFFAANLVTKGKSENTVGSGK